MRFVCAADCGVDRYDDRDVERAGGIGLNVAVHARLCVRTARLGDRSRAGRRRSTARTSCATRSRTHASSPASRSCRRHARRSTSATQATASASSRATTRACCAGFRVSARQAAAIAAGDVLATAAFGQALTFFESVMAAPVGRPLRGRLHERQRRRRSGRVRRALGARARRGHLRPPALRRRADRCTRGDRPSQRPALRRHARARRRARPQRRTSHRPPRPARGAGGRHDGCRGRVHGGLPVRVRAQRERRARRSPAEPRWQRRRSAISARSNAARDAGRADPGRTWIAAPPSRGSPLATWRVAIVVMAAGRPRLRAR